MTTRATTTAFDDGIVDRLIDARYLDGSHAAAAYVAHLSARILDEMGFHALPCEPQPAAAIAAALGVAAGARAAFEWLLCSSAVTPYVSSAPAAEGACWYAPTPRRPTEHDLREVRPSGFESSTAMLDYAAAAYPAFLRGTRPGAMILLARMGLVHWTEYFSDANALYDVHNQLAAAAVAAHLPHRPGVRVLELGAGTGGASAAIARAIVERRADPVDLMLSDVSRSFLTQAVARVGPLAPAVRGLQIDFDRPLDAQGIEPRSLDVIVAVNALHNAVDIPRTLAHLGAALSDDGVLVVSESLCGAGALVHQEFVFNLLGAPRHGARASRFLSADQWNDLLRGTPLEVRTLINGHGPELALLAIARAPAEQFVAAPGCCR